MNVFGVRVVPVAVRPTAFDGSTPPTPFATWQRCRVCGREKAPATFPRDPASPTGRGAVCLGCGGTKAVAAKRPGAMLRREAVARPSAPPPPPQAEPQLRMCGGCHRRIVILPAGASPCACAAKPFPQRKAARP